MKCEKCGVNTSMVTHRALKSGVIKRMRRCPICKQTFNTYEIKEETIKNIIKDISAETLNEGTTLCWTCQRATGRCSWSREFKEVQGWVATPTVNLEENSPDIPSFDVIECPLYIKDKRKKI